MNWTKSTEEGRKSVDVVTYVALIEHSIQNHFLNNLD